MFDNLVKWTYLNKIYFRPSLGLVFSLSNYWSRIRGRLSRLGKIYFENLMESDLLFFMLLPKLQLYWNKSEVDLVMSGPMWGTRNCQIPHRSRLKFFGLKVVRMEIKLWFIPVVVGGRFFTKHRHEYDWEFYKGNLQIIIG